VGQETDSYFDRLVAAFEAAGVDPGGDPELLERLDLLAEGDYVAPEVDMSDTTAPGPHGPVPVRVHRPLQGEALSLLVWCHGGAFAFGDLDMPEADLVAREVCDQAGAVVITVDYRLAVDGVHYPVPLDDVVAAWEWAVAQADVWGIDEQQRHLGGGSAGANLAAGAALRLRDTGGPLPGSLALMYPVVHPTLPEASAELTGKLREASRFMVFGPDLLEPVVENYLGAPAAAATAYAMPGLADLQGLPPTLVVTCEYDGLRASGEAFVDALTLAGVKVESHLAPAVTHAHLNTPGLAEARRTLADLAGWVAGRCHPAGAGRTVEG